MTEIQNIIMSQLKVFNTKIEDKLNELVNVGIDINDIAIYYHEPICNGNTVKMTVTFDLKRKNYI